MGVAFMQAFQIIVLATGQVPTGPQLVAWDTYEKNGGSVDSIASAFVASSMFANKYNGGILVDPNSAITSSIATEIIQNALGHPPTTNQVSAWVDSSLSVAQVLKAFALGDQFSADPVPHVQVAGGVDPFPAFFEIYGLATGSFTGAAQALPDWWHYELSDGSINDIASAFIGSTAFANLYNGGQAVDPSSPVTSTIASEIIANATGGTPSAAEVDALVTSGLSSLGVFEALAFSDQYSAYVASQLFFG
jgi:hypothetical protein